MTAIAHPTEYYLVVDIQQDRPILVFLGHDPKTGARSGPAAEPVHLELLAPHERLGRPSRPALGRSALGQARNNPTSFREFASADDLWEAGFLPVALYRICDAWDDYFAPWTAASETDQASSATNDESGGTH